MKIAITAPKPESLELELTVMLTLKELRELSAQLSAKWPSSRLAEAIDRATQKYTTHVVEPVEVR